MATSYSYACTHCDYQVMMSGKPDRLMRSSTTPVECLHCHSVYDQYWAKSWQRDPDEKPLMPCPHCESPDYKHWNNHKKPCPNCRLGILYRDSFGPAMFAD